MTYYLLIIPAVSFLLLLAGLRLLGIKLNMMQTLGVFVVYLLGCGLSTTFS